MSWLARGAVSILVAVTASVAAPPAARADPVTVTTGLVETAPVLSLARVLFEGSDFFLRIGVDGFRSTVALDCLPCTPGTTVNLDGHFEASRAVGTATVDGVAYPEIFADGMTGTFTAGSFVIGGEGPQIVSLPFVYSGVVSGYLEDPLLVGFANPVFVKTLTGAGLATATFAYFVADGSPFFSVSDLRYEFGDTAPVPEPASMLLIGTGLAGLAGLRRTKPRSRMHAPGSDRLRGEADDRPGGWTRLLTEGYR